MWIIVTRIRKCNSGEIVINRRNSIGFLKLQFRGNLRENGGNAEWK